MLSRGRLLVQLATQQATSTSTKQLNSNDTHSILKQYSSTRISSTSSPGAVLEEKTAAIVVKDMNTPCVVQEMTFPGAAFEEIYSPAAVIEVMNLPDAVVEGENSPAAVLEELCPSPAAVLDEMTLPPIVLEVNNPAVVLEEIYSPATVVVEETTFPDVCVKEVNSCAVVFEDINYPAVIVEKMIQPAVVVEKISPLPSTFSCFEGDGLNFRSYNRPNQLRKEKGPEAMEQMLEIPGNNMNEALLPSDSEEYLPDTSSYDEEYIPSNQQRKLTRKRKHLRHTTNRDVCLVNDSDGIEQDQPGVGKDTTEVDGQNVDEEPCIVENLEASNCKKRRKGEEVNPRNWARNVNSAKRRKGEKYFGLQKQYDGKYKLVNERKERTLKARCTCKGVRHFTCEKVTEIERQNIFNTFWKGIDSWEAKQATVVSLVNKSAPSFRRGTSDGETFRKNTSFMYYLNAGNERQRVCKTMFLNTFCLGEKSVRSWVMNSPLGRPVVEEMYENDIDNPQAVNENASNCPVLLKQNKYKRSEIRLFLESLPKMESHYCRANTAKEYLEPMWASKSQLFTEYERNCQEKNVQPASTTLFHSVFKAMNIGFFLPKKDQCETCIKYKLGTVSAEDYQNHQKRKNESREEKERDKKTSQATNKMLVYAVDVQKVLTCPDIKASTAYYKTKLKVHNWSVYNLGTSDGTCYIWHEGNGDVDSNVFASMLVRFLSKEVENKPDVTEIIIWSDGCTYQNRCENVSNALLHFAVSRGVTVYQKYLEVGHTQMEVDSMHSVIEKKIRKHEHYVPADYVRAIREARKHPRPYVVESLTYKDFLCYSGGYYKSIRPGSRKGDPCVTDLRCLKFQSDGHISYKLNYSDEWKELPRRPKSIKDVYAQLKPLYSRPLTIQERKFVDLQELKACLEVDYHPFYNGLRHGNCEGQCNHIKN